ncbi:MAG: WYL domain-containing protein, partial [Bacteroidota bacterium]
PAEFFAETIGITTENKASERVEIEANEVATKYIESQPLHSSQVSIGPNRFALTVQVNEELIRALLGFMGEIHILAPESLKRIWNERIQQQLSIENNGNIN